MALMLLARDPDRIKGVVSLALGAVLSAAAVVRFIVGRWVIAIFALVIASVDLCVAHLYTERAGRVLKRRTNPHSG